jgi:3-isopropylmalate dehydrogenase
VTDRTFKIAVLPGDGIGPEVCNQATRLLKEIESQLSGVRFDLQEHSVGVGQYLQSGNALPDSAFEACEKSDAVLLGSMSL